jgi:predicted nuclease with TOPRIM domain
MDDPTKRSNGIVILDGEISDNDNDNDVDDFIVSMNDLIQTNKALGEKNKMLESNVYKLEQRLYELEHNKNDDCGFWILMGIAAIILIKI